MFYSLFSLYRQHGTTDCRIACLRMIAQILQKEINMKWPQSNREGVSLLRNYEGTQLFGFKTNGVMVSIIRAISVKRCLSTALLIGIKIILMKLS
jgi:ABC-type bacteriocin/lantibiotic exporter with double-glycine peptidase domain